MSLSPIQISKEIEKIALALIPDVVYLRSRDGGANISVDEIDLASKIFVLYNNQPTVSGDISDISGLVVETIPVEISFLKLADYDDNENDTDSLIDELYGYAQGIFDRLSLIEVQASYVQGYEISLGDGTTKIYDKVMSGVVLRFDLVTQRGIKC